jgi:hypothetical protein
MRVALGTTAATWRARAEVPEDADDAVDGKILP